MRCRSAATEEEEAAAAAANTGIFSVTPSSMADFDYLGQSTKGDLDLNLAINGEAGLDGPIEDVARMEAQEAESLLNHLGIPGLLEGVSNSFSRNFQFIDSIRAHLSYTLLRASMSQSPVIFKYATGIFAVLLLQFRESRKAEIGVFFPVIILRSLDGSDLNQKSSVLRMLEKVCKDPQMLVDLYVNYDCDLEAPNLFERTIATLSKISQGTQNVDPKSPTTSQAGSIKTSSLQGLVNVLKSLVIWEKSHRESDKLSRRSRKRKLAKLSNCQ